MQEAGIDIATQRAKNICRVPEGTFCAHNYRVRHGPRARSHLFRSRPIFSTGAFPIPRLPPELPGNNAKPFAACAMKFAPKCRVFSTKSPRRIHSGQRAAAALCKGRSALAPRAFGAYAKRRVAINTRQRLQSPTSRSSADLFSRLTCFIVLIAWLFFRSPAQKSRAVPETPAREVVELHLDHQLGSERLPLHGGVSCSSGLGLPALDPWRAPGGLISRSSLFGQRRTIFIAESTDVKRQHGPAVPWNRTGRAAANRQGLLAFQSIGILRPRNPRCVAVLIFCIPVSLAALVGKVIALGHKRRPDPRPWNHLRAMSDILCSPERATWLSGSSTRTLS